MVRTGRSSLGRRSVDAAQEPRDVQRIRVGALAPSANASSIALARPVFSYFDRAEAQAAPSVWRAMSRIRSLQMRDHSMSAAGRTCFARVWCFKAHAITTCAIAVSMTCASVAATHLGE